MVYSPNVVKKDHLVHGLLVLSLMTGNISQMKYIIQGGTILNRISKVEIKCCLAWLSAFTLHHHITAAHYQHYNSG